MNALRAHLAELGIIAARGLPSVAALMTIVREGEDTRLPAAARFALMAVADQIDALADQIFKLERAIVTEAKRDEDMRRLTTIPGVGAITAATIKALVPDPGGFKSARHFAAWVGLTPRPHSSGVQGTTSAGSLKWAIPNFVLSWSSGRQPFCGLPRNDDRARPWLKALPARRPFKVAAVALANKMARIIWALFLNKGGIYHRPEPLGSLRLPDEGYDRQTNLTGARLADARCNYRR